MTSFQAILAQELGQESGQESAQDPSRTPADKPVVLAPPVPLVPLSRSGADPVPGSGGTASDSPGSVLRKLDLDETRQRLRGGIEVDPLSEVQPDAIGAAVGGDGGLGADLWQGSDRTTLEGLLRHLPDRIASSALSDVVRRALLSAADVPQSGESAEGSTMLLAQAFGSGTDAMPEAADRSAGRQSQGNQGRFLSLRARALADLGDVAGLRDLLQAIPRREVDEIISRVRVETGFLAAEDEASCAIVQEQIGLNPAEIFWAKALIVCQLLAGDLDGATLGLDLLRESGEGDTAFFALAESTGGSSADPVAADDVTALHVTLSRVSGARRVVPTSFQSANPAILAAIATSSANYSLEQRSLAAELAVAQDSLPVRVLAEVYQTFDFQDSELETAIDTAVGIEGPLGRALLYQSARRQTLPVARAELLSEALQRVAPAGAGDLHLYRATARLLSPLLAQTPAIPELTWFADTAGRALYLTGLWEQAESWRQLAQRLSTADAQAERAALTLWPYDRVTRSGGTEADLAGWYVQRTENVQQAVQAADEDSLERSDLRGLSAPQLAALRAALGALGDEPTLSWSGLLASGFTAGSADLDPVALLALAEAGDRGRRGETVLLAAFAAGADSPADWNALSAAGVIAALHRSGLDREARAVAIEVLAANGL